MEKKSRKIILIILVILTLFTSLGFFSFSLFKKYNEPNILENKQLYITPPSYTSQKKDELDILPNNFESIVKENNLEINQQDIREILLTGSVTLKKPNFFKPSENTKLLLSTENITKYVFSNINSSEKNFTNKIEKEITRATNKIYHKAFLLLPFVNQEERKNILSIYNNSSINTQEYIGSKEFNKLLNITNEKDKIVSLISLKNSFENKDNNIEYFNGKNEIYIEENESYYKALLEYIIKKKEVLQSINIYSNEYEPIIDTLQNILNKNTQVYSDILSIDGKYIYLYTLEDNTVALSTTDIYKEYTEIDTSYDILPTEQNRGTVRIPVIMYHQITNPPQNVSTFVSNLYLNELEFEKQIAYLTKKGYKTLSSQEFLDILKTGNNPVDKSIMLTFDDSTISHYTNAYRILKKYNQIGTFFVVSHKSQIINTQLKEMADNGMDIQSHTQTHPDLVKLKDMNKMYSEIAGSKTELEARTGKPVIAIAYPGCVADSRGFSTASSSGYELGFSCGKSIDHRYSKNFSLSRVHNANNIEGLKKILSGIYPF